MGAPLVLARGAALADERYRHAAALVTRLRALAPGSPLDFAPAYVPRLSRPAGHGVACRAAGGWVLGYAFAPQRGEAEAIADMEALQADLAHVHLLGERGSLPVTPYRWAASARRAA